MRTDRRTFMKAAAIVLASGCTHVGRSTRHVDASLKPEADALLQRAIEAGDVPGVVASATTRDDTIYRAAFGLRVLGQPAVMTADTVVWIASMTKPLTTTAAMQLVEQARLDLDSPASRWLPSVGEVQVLEGWDADGKPRLRAPRRAITLRHMLTHTAGWGYDIWNPDLGRYQQVTGLPRIGTGKSAALRAPLLFDPGERWQYGIGIDWAGKTIEAVTGKRLGNYLHENILGPLGMTSTAFKIPPAMRERLAKVHTRGTDGTLSPGPFEVPQDPEFEPGGGGLYSTAEDYLQFVRMILNQGKGNGIQVLKPETVDLMSHAAMGNLKVRLLKTAIPALSNDAEFFPGLPKTWGLGFMINEEVAPTHRSPGSLAWAGLANTYFWVDPRLGVGGVYVTQVLPFADTKSLPLFYSFETAVYRSIT